MPLPLFTGATNTVQLLADRPNQTDGLTPAQLKLKFDQHAINYETYSNDTLVPAINLELISKTEALTTHKTSTDHDGRYYTEIEIDDKVAVLATKSEISAIVLGQIPNGSITDEKLSNEAGMIKSQLAEMETNNTRLTTDKTLNGAINELFTNANNGKQNWVDVVGTPLLNTDAFATLKSKTQTLKDTMASNLTAKGQGSVGTEELSALLNKIPNISTGKGFATGTVTPSASTVAFTDGTGATNNMRTITVSGLTFLPRIIFCTNATQKTTTFYFSEGVFDNTYGVTVKIRINAEGSYELYYKVLQSAYINGTGFQLPAYSSGNYIWYAWE